MYAIANNILHNREIVKGGEEKNISTAATTPAIKVAAATATITMKRLN